MQFISEGEDLVFDLAEHLQDHFNGSTWDGWPKCPDHKNHSLEPMLVDSKAVWQCPKGRVVAIIGDL